MKERPILFNAEMVRAYLSGTKTQTRRVIKPQPINRPVLVDGQWLDAECFAPCVKMKCPYGQPGDRIWGRDRIVADIVEVRVERVQDISEDDAMAEGIVIKSYNGFDVSDERARSCELGYTHKANFANLWDSINPEPGKNWDSNPWVWVVEFRPVTQGGQK